MGKTRAEIQKAYRERKKLENGSEFLKKEANRVKTYYVPTAELPKKKLRKRRKKIRNAMKNKRVREQQYDNEPQVQNEQPIEHNDHNTETDISVDLGPCDSTTYADVTSSSTSMPIAIAQRLTVKMDFQSRERGRKKESASAKRAKGEIRKLKLNLENVPRKNSVLRQRLSRIDKHKLRQTSAALNEIDSIIVQEYDTSTPRQSSSNISLTPRSRSKALLRSSGLSPRRHSSISKKLQLHESMIDDMKSTDNVANLVCGSTAQRCRQLSAFSKSMDMNRKKLLRAVRGPTNMQRRKIAEKARIRNTVVQFMERNDNSACLPGKADCVKTGNGTQQKRVLNDLLNNLHLKFRSEYPDIKINVSTFGSYRPKYIKLVHYSSRKTCLCQRHQNMALKVKGLHAAGISNATTPDSYIRQSTDEDLLFEIQNHNSTSVKYAEWQRVEVEHKGRKTKRMQVVQIEKAKPDFIELMKTAIPEFRSHCMRVKVQYEEVKRLKDKLPYDQAIIQMDFAENYVCSHADEVQSAYFDKGSVTLHPTVIYFKNSENKLIHESHVVVSDTQMHNSGTVLAIIREIVPIVSQLVSNLKMIHYVTDSPTSQYRNKHVFYVVANHHNLFEGISASWQYFEAGHGKGPCDGVGGTAKRQADSAVKRQICNIQNADDFYAWGSTQVHSNVKYIFVSDSKCIEASTDLKRLNIKPVKGTMAVHSVISTGDNHIAVRHTSCVCDQCFEDGKWHTHCRGWSSHTIEFSEKSTTKDDMGCTEDTHEIVTDQEPINKSSTNDEIVVQQYATYTYVAALYDDKWYIGKVLDFDPFDNTYQISFMVEGSNTRGITFKWPDKEDLLWLPHRSILCGVGEPIMYAKTRRVYKLSVEDIETIENISQA